MKFIQSSYNKLYQDWYSKDLDFHKSRVKKMFKEIKKYGFSQACFIETNFIAEYVVKYLPYRKDNFKFTLMNAQHTYAKCLGFHSWKELKNFCICISSDQFGNMFPSDTFFDVSKLRTDLMKIKLEDIK